MEIYFPFFKNIFDVETFFSFNLISIYIYSFTKLLDNLINLNCKFEANWLLYVHIIDFALYKIKDLTFKNLWQLAFFSKKKLRFAALDIRSIYYIIMSTYYKKFNFDILLYTYIPTYLLMIENDCFHSLLIHFPCDNIYKCIYTRIYILLYILIRRKSRP